MPCSHIGWRAIDQEQLTGSPWLQSPVWSQVRGLIVQSSYIVPVFIFTFTIATPPPLPLLRSATTTAVRCFRSARLSSQTTVNGSFESLQTKARWTVSMCTGGAGPHDLDQCVGHPSLWCPHPFTALGDGDCQSRYELRSAAAVVLLSRAGCWSS